MIFDNLVVARVASLLNMSPVEVRKRREPMGLIPSVQRWACLAKTLFLSLDMFESSVTRPGLPSPAAWTNVV